MCAFGVLNPRQRFLCPAHIKIYDRAVKFGASIKTSSTEQKNQPKLFNLEKHFKDFFFQISKNQTHTKIEFIWLYFWYQILYFTWQDVMWNILYLVMLVVFAEIAVMATKNLVRFKRDRNVKVPREETEALYL